MILFLLLLRLLLLFLLLRLLLLLLLLLLLIIIINSTHSTCGVLCTVSIWRGVRGYLKILAVVIVIGDSSSKSVDTGAVN